MKIDLHCHTKEIKAGDKGRGVDAAMFSQKLQAAGVCIAAITNHNSFDIAQYRNFVQVAGSSIMIWPGVELDVRGHYGDKEAFGHITIIVDPENVVEFAEIISHKCKGDLENFAVDIDEVIPMLEVIPRYFIACHHMKAPALSEADIRHLEIGANEFSVVVREPSSSRKAGMIVNANSNCWYGSDIKSWEHYDGRDLPELTFEISSFGAFLDLLGKNNTAVTLKTCLNKKGPTKVHIELYGDLALDLDLYNDVNVIFGEKATGKSDILHAIDDYFTTAGKLVERFYIEGKKDSLQSRIDRRPSEADISSFSDMFCEEELSVISSWTQGNLPSLKKFKEAKENANKVALLKRLGISRATFSDFLDENLMAAKREAVADDIDALNEAISIARKNILDPSETSILIDLLERLKKTIIAKHERTWVEYQAKQLARFTINHIKTTLAAKEGIPVTPSDIGLSQTFQEYTSVCIAARKIKRCIACEKTLQPVPIGKLSSKGEVRLVALGVRT